MLAVAGCAGMLKQCGGVADQATKSSVNKLSTVNPPTAVAIGGCIFLAGYCAGKLRTKGVDIALGFK